MFRSAVFDRNGKNNGYFCQLRLGSLALAFCLLQIRHRDEIKLFESIIAFIWMNYL